MKSLSHYPSYRQPDMTLSNMAIIIEDEVPLQIMYERVVQMQGYKTLVASNGRDALQLLQHHIPSVIFLDILLPYVSGQDILNFIAQEPRFQKTHVILMSSNAEFRSLQHRFHSCEFHLKPLLPSHIQTILKNLIHHP